MKDQKNSNIETNLEAKKEFVEKAGMQLEKIFSMSPIVARVSAYFFVADPPEKSFFEIQEFIGASKSAISNALNQLIIKGSVEEITKPGERKRYFRFRLGKERFPVLTANRVSMFTSMVALGKEALKIRSNDHPEFNKEIEEMIELWTLIKDQFPLLIEKWRKS